MNGTFHLIKNGGEEIFLDGENIERITKSDAGEEASRFYVEVVKKCIGIELAHKPEVITGVASITFYPNIKEKHEL